MGFGPMLVHTMRGDGMLGNLWIYLVGPLLGAVVAAVTFAVQGEE